MTTLNDKDTDFEAGAVLLVDKPVGWTSFDVVNKIRYALRKKLQKKNIKVGHAGTLDPLASGLLIVCTGAATKRIDSFMGMPKTYTGVITLGGITPSFDLETPVSQTFSTIHIDRPLLEKARKQFLGVISQVPPIFSAIKKDGKPLYESARKNEAVEIAARQVEIFEFELSPEPFTAAKTDFMNVEFSIQCSKGTYIRSIANDFGVACGSGAYLSALCRTAIGEYNLGKAWEIKDLISAILSA